MDEQRRLVNGINRLGKHKKDSLQESSGVEQSISVYHYKPKWTTKNKWHFVARSIKLGSQSHMWKDEGKQV